MRQVYPANGVWNMKATGIRTLGWFIPAILAAACLVALPEAHAEPRQGGDTCMDAEPIPDVQILEPLAVPRRDTKGK